MKNNLIIILCVIGCGNVLVKADTITSGSVGLLIPSTGVIDRSRRIDEKYNSNFRVVASTLTTALNNITTLTTNLDTFSNFRSTSDQKIDNSLINGTGVIVSSHIADGVIINSGSTTTWTGLNTFAADVDVVNGSITVRGTNAGMIINSTPVATIFHIQQATTSFERPQEINNSTNPVDWSSLKNVPAGFSDGIDDGTSGVSFYTKDGFQGEVSTVQILGNFIAYVEGSTGIIRSPDIRQTTGAICRFNFWESTGSDTVYDTINPTRSARVVSPNSGILWYSTGGLNNQNCILTTGAAIIIPHDSTLSQAHQGATGKYSVGLWIHPTIIAGNQDFIEKTTGGNEWYGRLDASGAIQFQLYTTGGANITTIVSTATINVNEDNHILWTYDRERTQFSYLYINGNDSGSSPSEAANSSGVGTDTLTFGNAHNDRSYQGKLLQLTIWPYAVDSVSGAVSRIYGERKIVVR